MRLLNLNVNIINGVTMTENEKKLLAEFLSTTLNMDAEAISGLYNEDGELQTLESPLDVYKERIAKFKKAETDQYSRGKKEAMTNFEKSVREKYDVEDQQLIGIELLDHVVQTNVEKAKSPEVVEIEKHPDYTRIKREHEKALALKDKEWQEKHDALQTQHQKEHIWREVEREALVIFDGLKPILPEDPAKAAKWKSTFLSELQKLHYKKDGDQITILNEDGTPADDGMGNLKKFNELVKNTAADYFDFQAAEDRSAPGTPPGTPPTQRTVIKTEADFLEASKNAKSPEERAALLENFKKNKV